MTDRYDHCVADRMSDSQTVSEIPPCSPWTLEALTDPVAYY